MCAGRPVSRRPSSTVRRTQWTVCGRPSLRTVRFRHRYVHVYEYRPVHRRQSGPRPCGRTVSVPDERNRLGTPPHVFQCPVAPTVPLESRARYVWVDMDRRLAGRHDRRGRHGPCPRWMCPPRRGRGCPRRLATHSSSHRVGHVCRGGRRRYVLCCLGVGGHGGTGLDIVTRKRRVLCGPSGPHQYHGRDVGVSRRRRRRAGHCRSVVGCVVDGPTDRPRRRQRRASHCAGRRPCAARHVGSFANGHVAPRRRAHVDPVAMDGGGRRRRHGRAIPGQSSGRRHPRTVGRAPTHGH